MLPSAGLYRTHSLIPACHSFVSDECDEDTDTGERGGAVTCFLIKLVCFGFWSEKLPVPVLTGDSVLFALCLL